MSKVQHLYKISTSVPFCSCPLALRIEPGASYLPDKFALALSKSPALFYDIGLSCVPGWPQIYYIVEDDLKLLNLLSPPPK